ncbi:MAG: hypothetical protein QOD44_2551 [Solirubrobacteraceae bacterium]|nr:hypothetical protein [Solirubrobacteraceae bacterium]
MVGGPEARPGGLDGPTTEGPAAVATSPSGPTGNCCAGYRATAIGPAVPPLDDST